MKLKPKQKDKVDAYSTRKSVVSRSTDPADILRGMDNVYSGIITQLLAAFQVFAA